MDRTVSNKNIIMLRTTSIKNDSRVTKEAIALSELGYGVKILGWDRDNFLGKEEKTLDENNKIPIVVYKEKSNYGDGMKNLLKFLKFQIWIFFKLIKERKNIDIIHSCDFDTAIPSKIIAKFFKKKLVYDIFDYYVDSHYIPKKLEKSIEKKEINMINQADLTIICTEQRKEQIKRANPKKCIVIYNTPNIINKVDYDSIIKSSNNKIKLVYVGILQKDRLLQEIAQEIIKHKDIELHIGGFGSLENYFQELSQKYSNILYYGKMQYNDVLCLEKECDILFATYNPLITNHKFSAPNKLYEAMALGKPIIVCKDTGIDEIVQDEEIGVCISYDEKEFIRSVEKLRDNKELRNKFSNNANKIYKEKYSWEQMKRILEKEYKKL